MNTKKLSILILVILVIVLIGGVVWLQFKSKTNNKVNVLPPEKQAIEDRYAQERAAGQKNPAPKNTQIATSTVITLGQEFILKKNEIVRLQNTNTFLSLEEKTYGYLNLEEEIKKNGLFRYRFSDADGAPYIEVPYNVTVKDTDNQTYVKLVVTSAENDCAVKTGTAGDQCWNTLAQRLTDTNYCNKIQNQAVKNSCFEYLAATTENPSQFCQQKVFSPKSYCQLFNKSFWKTFSSPVYGLSIQYPPGLFKVITNTDNSISISNLYPIGADDSAYTGTELSGVSIKVMPFNTEFNVAMDSYKLRYDQNSNVWIRSTWDDSKNTYTDSQSCEKTNPLGIQQVSAYDVSYKYKREYVFILKQGLLYISEEPEEQPIPPEAHKSFDEMVNSITFEHPELIVRVKCN